MFGGNKVCRAGIRSVGNPAPSFALLQVRGRQLSCRYAVERWPERSGQQPANLRTSACRRQHAASGESIPMRHTHANDCRAACAALRFSRLQRQLCGAWPPPMRSPGLDVSVLALGRLPAIDSAHVSIMDKTRKQLSWAAARRETKVHRHATGRRRPYASGHEAARCCKPLAGWHMSRRRRWLHHPAVRSQNTEPPRVSWRLFGLSQAATVVA